jgi:hypothetical protein
VNMSYERAHSLPADGQIRGRLLTTKGVGVGDPSKHLDPQACAIKVRRSCPFETTFFR